MTTFVPGIIYQLRMVAAGPGFFELKEGPKDQIQLVIKLEDIKGYDLINWFKDPKLVSRRADTDNYVYVSHQVINDSIVTRIRHK